MNMTIKITMDNAAFGERDEDTGTAELARILREYAHDLEHDDAVFGCNKRLFDINGNACGRVTY